MPPVYGTLKPTNSWNPIIINYQHLWGITKDAWYSQKLKDKFKTVSDKLLEVTSL